HHAHADAIVFRPEETGPPDRLTGFATVDDGVDARPVRRSEGDAVHAHGVLPQPLIASTSVLPRRAGEGETLMPAASIAAILSSAPPLPPEMTAPAWPMVRPGGAVRPAMKPAIGFLRPHLASSRMNC